MSTTTAVDTTGMIYVGFWDTYVRWIFDFEPCKALVRFALFAAFLVGIPSLSSWIYYARWEELNTEIWVPQYISWWGMGDVDHQMNENI